MAGIVFQELREARALAYSVGARYVTGSRKGEQNLMAGGMGSQVDKTPEGIEAFVDLLDNMPVSPERFVIAKDALINSFVSSRLGFRDILPAVRGWERLEVPVDPRRERYERVIAADMETMLAVYRDQIAGRPKLISIVGAKSNLDMDRLSKVGHVVEVPLERLFVE
jgi:predicted Zn-dependent peptidase